MKKSTRTHNLLIVSDFHMAEGLIAEAGEHFYGHEAFLYDSSFVRFLRYHEGLKREASDRLIAGNHSEQEAQKPKDIVLPHDEVLRRNWRLVLAGDIFDFWDITQVPDDLEKLVEEIDQALEEIRDENEAAFIWLQQWRAVFKPSRKRVGVLDLRWKQNWKKDIEGRLVEQKLLRRDYAVIRKEIDELGISNGEHRRSFEQLAWWIQVIIHKPGFELSRSENKHGLGTTWQEVVWKLTRIYRGHREFFAALAWFIACDNEIVLLKGNHDLELHWPQIHNGHLPHILMDVYRDIIEGRPIGPSFNEFRPEEIARLPDYRSFCAHFPNLAAKPQSGMGLSSIRYTFEDWFYYEEDLVYIEHGNQYEPLDSSVNFLEPKLPSDPEKIELPWGALMARYVYNKIVAVHPFGVNIKPEERIIYWMINHDLFRIIGILLAAIPDVFSALWRAVKQGLRGKWILGDRSFLGLIPRLIYDLVLLVTPGMWKRDQEFQRVHDEKVEEMVEAYCSTTAASGADDEKQLPDEDAEPAERPLAILFARILVHFGSLALSITLLVSSRYWLADIQIPSIIGPLLAIFGVVTISGILLGMSSGDPDKSRQALGENLLQHGAVGTLVGMIAWLFLARMFGWSSITIALMILPPFVLGVIGSWIIVKASGNLVEAFSPTRISGGWPATVLRSSVSVLRELSLAAFVAAVYFFLRPREGMEMMPWLLSSLALIFVAWIGKQIFVNYVERRNLAILTDRSLATISRWIRNVATILIGILILVVLASVISALANITLPDWSYVDVESALDLAESVSTQLTLERDTQGKVPPLVMIISAIVGTILMATVISRGLRRLSDGRLHTWLRKLVARISRNKVNKKDSFAWDERKFVADQLQAIEDLARKEQLRFATDMLRVLNFLLPALAISILVIAVLGLGTAVGAIAANLNPVGGISIGVLMSVLYWLVRQFSASFQRQDPASGFGDLFERTARSISQVLSTQGEGLGRPTYFIFGHDHWADSKRIDDQSENPGEGSLTRNRWYVNAGTWLRGYVEEQRRQEVNENHSTFIQILPGWGEDAAPRVFRWNDDVNEPEHIIRREEPRSAARLLWERWEHDWPGQLVWLTLFILAALIRPEWMWGLIPILWAIGLGIVLSLIKLVDRWIGDWRKYSSQ